LRYLLDTNCCIQYLRTGRNSRLAVRLEGLAPSEAGLCSVVVAELYYGARRSRDPARNIVAVRRFCGGFVSIPFSDDAALEYAEIRAELEHQGTRIGPNDLMIAAIARVHGLVLVTHNVGEFSRVSGLLIEDWQTP
jgi:tRNA(fMet)-specific endonuclease VapC